MDCKRYPLEDHWVFTKLLTTVAVMNVTDSGRDT